jgi:hypothetical protein
MIRPGVHCLGIDDGPFERKRHRDVLVVGALYRGGDVFDGLLTTRVRQDGWNATDRLTAMIQGSKFREQLHYVLLDGIALGGFNLVDLDRLHAETGLKLMTVMRRLPDLGAMERALAHLPRSRDRLERLGRAGPIVPVGRLFCQLRGMDPAEAEDLVALTATRSHLPEPLRAAHLIAAGLVTGQSGRAA